mgnify:CR=1 FL=1
MRVLSVAGALSLALGAALYPVGDARAVGLASSESVTPIEERALLAVSPERSVLFSQVRFDSRGSDVAVVVPVPVGAALDWSSRAFFEALEVASAPRVVGPDDNDTCPGHDTTAVDVAGDEEGLETLEPAEIVLLDDAPAVEAWAISRGLTVSPTLSLALAAETNVRFFAARFVAPKGVSLTKALRVVSNAPNLRLPLVLSEAGSEDMRVTAWALGSGRGALEGTPVAIDLPALILEAGPQTSNYEDLLFGALKTGPDVPAPVLLQMSSHESLRDDISVKPDGPIIKSFVRGYFERAAAYAETEGRPSSCIAQSAAVLGQSARVGLACPRSDLGVVGGAATCAADIVEPGEVDPALLRCGAKVDDLAMMLSALSPEDAWLTRATVRIAASGSGTARSVSFPGGSRVDPDLVAGSVDLSDCGEGGAGGGTSGSSNGPSSSGAGAASSGNGISSASGGTVDVPLYVYDGCSACADGSYTLVDYIEADSADAPDAYYEGDDCSGDTASSYSGEGCDGDTAEYSEIDFDSDACDCSDTSVDFGDEGCDCDSSGYSDTCSGDSFGDGCDCGGESFCATAKKPGKRVRTPRRINAFVYGALVIIVPLRRLSRAFASKKASSRQTKR